MCLSIFPCGSLERRSTWFKSKSCPSDVFFSTHCMHMSTSVKNSWWPTAWPALGLWLREEAHEASQVFLVFPCAQRKFAQKRAGWLWETENTSKNGSQVRGLKLMFPEKNKSTFWECQIPKVVVLSCRETASVEVEACGWVMSRAEPGFWPTPSWWVLSDWFF